jgi:putative Holliday junction resolvase
VDFEKIGAVVEEYGVGEIVVGSPVRLGGEVSAQTKKVLGFAEELRARFGLPVRMWDERLTSLEAEEMLGKQRSVKGHIAQRKSGVVDRMAAVIILQSYLDRLTRD